MDFNMLISERMERYNYLLRHSGLDFKQHQYDGVQWCVRNELTQEPIQNVRGGFIADEMGLGKTLTMIGTMFVNLLSNTLIVVPPILLEQWHNEIYRCSGHKALIYYGTNKKLLTVTDIKNARIVLTSYNTLLSKSSLLHLIKWKRIIFDEAHHLRNSKTAIFKASKLLRTRIKWLVSGTPVQNRKQDFYSLCDSVGFKKSFYSDPNNIKVIGKNFILRRTKSQVGINLPKLNSQLIKVSWKHSSEKQLSEEIHSLLPNVTNVHSFKRQKLAQIFGKSCSLVALLRARQSCIMTSLMKNEIQRYMTLGIISRTYGEGMNYSSKLDYAINFILTRKDNGNGKIIFCHFRNEIDIIASRLQQGGITNIITYDGRNSRNGLMAEHAYVIILQIQTGCEGLNLQKNFNEVYFISPHWNPSVEDQAVARCHRIGQEKPVFVFKFEMDNFDRLQDQLNQPISLEKYVNNKQEKKREISREILQEEIKHPLQ
jgi:SNF2 family DNA or RNA helicase